jgi:hypothetical protein
MLLSYKIGGVINFVRFNYHHFDFMDINNKLVKIFKNNFFKWFIKNINLKN